MSRIVKLLAAVTLGLAAHASAADPQFVPVFEENFPDAFVLPVGDQFFAYSTNDVQNVPMAVSRDLTHWQFLLNPDGSKHDAMPVLPSWAKAGFTWAPEVVRTPAGRYVLYYTANHRAKDRQCIGAAVADDPRGPFVDRSAQPLVCQFDLGGSIDPDGFRDGGKLYLYWKSDGNRIGKPSRLFGMALTPDGLAPTGAPTDLGISDRDEWKQRVIEAPTMMRVPEGYALLYSGGYFGWNPDQRLSPYAMSFARCDSPLGPCREGASQPILHSYAEPAGAGCLSGPGHQSVFRANGGTFISFHGWASTKSCRKAADKRYLYIAPFGWEDGKPVIAPSLRPTSGKTERG